MPKPQFLDQSQMNLHIDPRFQDLPVPIANEVYMTGEQVCGVLHISSRTLQKLRDERGIAYTVIGGKFLYPLSKLQLLLEENYRNYIR